MNMAFFTGAVGAIQQQQRMNVQANNISNVNNYGFKAERATFHHLMYGNVTGIDDERLPKGAGTKMAKASIDFSNDGYLETGRLFDFAIEGKGFFALFDPESGEISYTRDGAFVMAYFPFDGGETEEGGLPDGEWRLSDNEGRCVLDGAGNFIVIDPQDQKAELELGVFDFLIYDGMLHADSCRFIPIEKNGDLYMGSGTVRRGFIEVSNVDLSQEFIKVIESQRAYSTALRVVQTSDEIEQTINGLR